jgi:hypothetical protein
MEDLHFKATKTYPEIFFSANGELSISGRMINDDLIDFFQPLFSWAEKTQCNGIEFDIALDYINTSGTFLLLRLFKTFEANYSVNSITINWQFDEDDEEHYDIGCLIKKSLNRSEVKFLCKQSDDILGEEKYLLEIKANCQ